MMTRRTALAALAAPPAILSLAPAALRSKGLSEDPARAAFRRWRAAYAVDMRLSRVTSELRSIPENLHRTSLIAQEANDQTLAALVVTAPTTPEGLACVLRGIVYAAGFDAIRTRPGNPYFPDDAADFGPSDFNMVEGDFETIAVRGLWALIGATEAMVGNRLI